MTDSRLAHAPTPSQPAATRPPALQLGRVRVWPPVLQAPMAALTNLPMRTLAEEAGCGLTVTEFLAAPALAARRPKMVRKLTASRDDRPYSVQIFGRDPNEMRRAAALVVGLGAPLVDINMGCPAKKVTKGSCGAALMREPTLAVELVHAVREGVGERADVTVKMRTGWDEASKNAPELAARVVDAGAVAVTVHGRTREQRFGGTVDLESIRRVKQAVAVPVIANGDIVDLPSLERALEVTGADGVMIGRAACGDPWLFSRVRAWWEGQPIPALPTPTERLGMYRRHLGLYLEIEGETRAVIEMRKFAAWYLREWPGAAQLRKAIYAVEGIPELDAILDDAARLFDGGLDALRSRGVSYNACWPIR
ncbi:MAG: tRNA dihydrouridine synthase DusB [Deltaproteobacteria bacterium]|nr:tRNA dihydrouridine synthase DusB [Deltaproteobacteria bacterium]